jgi:hypothetical protein
MARLVCLSVCVRARVHTLKTWYHGITRSRLLYWSGFASVGVKKIPKNAITEGITSAPSETKLANSNYLELRRVNHVLKITPNTIFVFGVVLCFGGPNFAAKMMQLSSGTNRNRFTPMTVAELQDVTPEYARIPAICRMFGVSRPFVFDGFHKGVKSLHIKKPGASKGIRLVNVVSFREYLESFGG